MPGLARHALAARQQPNPDAMVLATTSPDGQPSARVVLCKELDVAQGRVSFVSNYDSRKGRELAQNSRAALVFHWDHSHRQIRMEGLVVKAPDAESDEYFASRNWQRRIGAWASAQSQPLRSREQLNASVRAAAARFGAPEPASRIQPPPPVDIPGLVLGGYFVWAVRGRWIRRRIALHDGRVDALPT